jgi:hypothetical protein
VAPVETPVNGLLDVSPRRLKQGGRANIDHLVIGPGGVFVIDSKQYRGRRQLDGSGRLWHGRSPLAPTLRAVDFEADQAARVLPDPGLAVVPIVAVHGAQVPWGKVVTGGVPMVSARRLPSMLRELPAVLAPERVAALANQAGSASTPPLDSMGTPLLRHMTQYDQPSHTRLLER